MLGTVNNCAMGFTPWKTYLACEENFNGYFRQPGTPTSLEARYGINASGNGNLWYTTDSRFDASIEPNEATPVRMGRRDRPVQARLHAGEAHRAGAPQARRRMGAGDEGRPGRRVHG